MGAVRTCLFVITIYIIQAVTAQDKRVPHGFVGMRGKKYSDLSPGEYLDMLKRKPQLHFIGVKGKKDLYDLENEFKRAPMGFVGMRGKKELPLDLYYPENDLGKGGSLIGEIDYSPNDNFDGKSEYPYLNDLLTQYLMRLESEEGSTETLPESTEDEMTNEISKRAANMHQFFGVRGKKSEQNKRPFDLNFRGKFIGVRGKKDVKNSGAQEIRFLLGQNGPWPKRKQMGFFGMRGKKWTDESSLENETPN